MVVGALLIGGTARADYNVKATEASLTALVSDARCNLTEAIASVNNGSALYGCSGSGKKIILEGTGAHYKVPTGGVSIAVTGAEITSKIANKDFIETDATQWVLLVQSGAGLTLTGLTIQRTGTSNFAQVLNNQGTLIVNNSVVQGGNAILDGGGIYNNGDLRLSGSKVQNNKTSKGGGGIYSNGPIGVTLTNSTVSNNTTGFSGAGIYGNNSPVKLTSSTVSGNKSSSNAGAIYNNNSTLTLDHVTIQSNTAGKNGGAIYNYQGTLNMTDSKVTGAHTAVHGGGIFHNCDETGHYGTLIRTTIEGATASGDGGGIYIQGYQEVSLFDSTVQNNKATGNGGGVYASSRQGLSFYTSTISNNTAGLNGGGVYSSGRCLGRSSTVSTNTATGTGGGIYSVRYTGDENNNYLELNWTTIGYNKGAVSGGVVLDNEFPNSQTRSSIIAKNQLTTGAFVDYVGSPHTQDPEGRPEYKSVFGEITGTVFRSYDIQHFSNILPLANNGGLTKTHEIPTTSSALDKFVTIPDSDWTCEPTDQRGLPRPRGAACDLGSYERQQ